MSLQDDNGKVGRLIRIGTRKSQVCYDVFENEMGIF